MNEPDPRAEHAKRRENSSVHASQIQAFGSDAMKAPAIVALGGVIALLGFYSAHYDRLSEDAEAMTALGSMLFWLFSCLILACVAPGLAYLSQIAYVESLYSEEHWMEKPFIRSTKRSRFFNSCGDIARWGCVIVVGGAIACLGRSFFLFFDLVRFH